MKIENNFFNIVALGSFNPDILKPEFLIKDCKAIISSNSEYKFIPNMVSEIKSEKYRFLMDLSRFQITEENIDDFSNNTILVIMCNYLKKLKYTPITKLGFNFNINLVTDKKSEFLERINNNKEIIKFFGVKKIFIQINKEIEKNKEERFISIQMSMQLTNNNNNLNIHVKDESDKFKINYNYELEKNDFLKICNKKSGINNIKNNYLETIKYFIGE